MSQSPSGDPRWNELISTAFQLKGTEFARCFGPGPSCNQPPIRAHSVQNARALDLLAHNGHVIAPTHRMHIQRGIEVDLSEVGRNKATTFAGLCESHDRELFSAIETQPIDVANEEQLFLFSYRATIYELHATCAAGWLLQMGYQKRVELGLDPKNEPSPAGLRATERLIVAYQTYLYKARFDEAYTSSGFGAVTHDVLTLDVPAPTIAASSLFSLDQLVNREGDVVRVALTILPLDPRRTAAIFSYLPHDATLARAHLSRVLASSGDHQKYEISRHLLNHCSNFVLSPAYVETWTAEKRALVTNYFTATILQDNLDFEHKDLVLF